MVRPLRCQIDKDHLVAMSGGAIILHLTSNYWRRGNMMAEDINALTDAVEKSVATGCGSTQTDGLEKPPC